MAHQSELIEKDILAYLEQHEKKEILRFLTCGSVDDGKSTLIGRLLHDSKMLYEDQLESVRKDSAKVGTQGEQVDLALLVDGLQAEREQGITIDVAYRYFSTAKRKFIIADTPGHEQYTRNMVTGASTCDVAVILVDARQGILTQTRRHTFIASLLGIKHVIVAINKMDLMDFAEDVFERIKDEYCEFASRLPIDDLQFIPISALNGDNVVDPSANMPWYTGATLMHLLEIVHIASDRNFVDFRMPVQRVNRPDSNFRGYSGTIESGVVKVGDAITVLPSRRSSKVERIVTMDGDLPEAFAPLAVTLTLEDEVDISRGDMICHSDNVPPCQDRFEAHLVWMNDEALEPGKQYIIKHTSHQVYGRIAQVNQRIDINTLEDHAAETLALNEIGRCEIALSEPVAFDPYALNRGTGSFIVVDRISNATLAAGMIISGAHHETRDAWDQQPSGELAPVDSAVTPEERQAQFSQKPATLLITGLAGSGKTTVAKALERLLHSAGHHSMLIDGQNLRLGMSRDLGFSAEDRSENLRRAAETARMINANGSIALIAFVAPLETARARARDVIGPEQFLEVYLSCPPEICRARHSRELYAAAERGEIPNFPGVSTTFQAPDNADLVLASDTLSPEACAEEIFALLQARGILLG